MIKLKTVIMKNSEYDEQSKESEMVDVEYYFHLEFVDVEPVKAL